jgi:hypothetical protein
MYVFDTSRLGKGNLGTFTFTLNGNYLSRYVAAINIGDKELEYAGQETGFGGYFPHNRLYASIFYDLGGLDAGVTVDYIGQGTENLFATKNFLPRKIREWTTVDAIVSYTFNLPPPVTDNQVAGYAKNGGRSVSSPGGKDKSVAPASTAAYSPCGWRVWLNGTTLTAGMNNIFDLEPPFFAAAADNGYDESAFNIKGRYWYVSVKKSF